MDKSIPRAAMEEEVLRTWDAPLLRFLCPNCKHVLPGLEANCKNCGQAINLKAMHGDYEREKEIYGE